MNTSFDKEKVRKHLPGGLFLSLVVIISLWLVISTVSWMTDEDRLPLSHMIIQGQLKHITADDIREAIDSMDSIGTFMTQDVNKLQDALLSLPWIAQVSVRKQWPETIKVFVVEHQPEATWNNNVIVNPEGVVFNAPMSDLLEPKPALFGPETSSKEVLAFWHQLQKQFAPLNITVHSVALTDRLSWQVVLDNGIRLELGRDAREERVNRFVALYKQLTDKKNSIDYIDLRYDTGAAVGWKPDDVED
ncbi:cell division protein FtsQ/DivIB [Aliivibrio sp. S4TY2]|uniref:cell division protein FtsQ/DivIB n=1 Tax=unclassified Aliivibrio TaxID=2645654 RepID=UPI0023798E84|nr:MULTISPECIES: cell division protein FtsQ/DivIB [unclassified Aliivibrio]MDD9155901.1 cell division protein FtsQ/DivIB [Aliivibrio sp. S4TY2]MDD9159419.1 cell division protein FtsQ/DivIB [Aliivibrio sp. S4TY1]MDD9163609.1 cell division protein FtsQ/DivIB [Aliivibrio sp. S4MY2]MDD9167610.1 cell division protein FtsQ/DivIB [Aliivibrio sp. S4MY4]MDD9186134.1 cell division protein FtsQ/DivIB [Aliivibrio sp. S4MY3]